MKDCILGLDIQEPDIQPQEGTTIKYFNKAIGKVIIAHPTFIALENDLKSCTNYSDQLRFIIAGICRNAHEKQEEPPLIDSQFLLSGYKQLNILSDFQGKVQHILKYMYDHGGNESAKFEFRSLSGGILAYTNPEEFNRIMIYLIDNYLIDVAKSDSFGRGLDVSYRGVKLTTLGVEKVEETLPKIPLISLVNDEITTGNQEVDDKIMHAKDLFFKEHATMNNKRSACESLSYILEPLREDLKKYFSSSDVSDFFNIVNNFDIRHNKDNTKNLEHEEQLEWVFFSLLNTINVYVKLEKKFK